MAKRVWIYALTDHDDVIRYVGQTNCVERRYIEHLCDANGGSKILKCRWLAEHLEDCGLPGVEVLDVCKLRRANFVEVKHQIANQRTVMQGDVVAVVNTGRYIKRRTRRRPESKGATRYRRLTDLRIAKMLMACDYGVALGDVLREFQLLRNEQVDVRAPHKYRRRRLAAPPKRPALKVPESMLALERKYYNVLRVEKIK